MIPDIVPAGQADTTPSTLAEAAARYAAAGWYVFRLQPYSKLPLVGSHGFRDATRDPDVIRAWWEEMPQANVGIDCGRSNLIVIDVDPRNGGDETFAAWTRKQAARGRSLPPTVTVATPSGGRHYYFTAPPGTEVPAKSRMGPGVDLQSAGGYVVAPPSVTLYGAWAKVDA